MSPTQPQDQHRRLQPYYRRRRRRRRPHDHHYCRLPEAPPLVGRGGTFTYRDWFAVFAPERLVVVANKPHLVPPGVFITRAEVLDAPATHAVVLLALRAPEAMHAHEAAH